MNAEIVIQCRVLNKKLSSDEEREINSILIIVSIVISHYIVIKGTLLFSTV
jgi:hypothetical protein